MRRGFTLLEALCVLAVLVVLATLALPDSLAALQRHRLAAAAEALAGDVAEARFEAARRGQALHLAAQAGPDWCWTVSPQPGCACPPPGAAGCSLKTVRAADHPGVALRQPVLLHLQPDGAVAGAVGTLGGNGGQELRVELTARGRARICVPAPVLQAPASRYPTC